MLRYLKRTGYVFSAFILVYMVYIMSLFLLRFGFDGASRQIFFVALGVYLVLPIFKDYKDKKEYDQEFEELRSCNKMINVLSGLDDSITALQGVTLKVEDDVYLIDDIIITKKGVFNVVECNTKGSILIEDGEKWYIKRRKGKELITSPINKIRSNREVLKQVFSDDQIIDVIVMTSFGTYVEGEENSMVGVVRCDELVDYINRYDEKEKYYVEELYEKLYPIIYSDKDLKDIKEKYNNLIDNRWRFRSRLSFISIFCILYVFKVMELGLIR